MSIFRSAVTGEDGSIDPGYLALYWTMAVTVGVIPLVVFMGALAVHADWDQSSAIIQATGIAVGAICTGGAAVIGAVGVFRMGDKPRAGVASSTVTTTTATTAPAPLKVDVVDMPDPKKRKRQC